MTTWMKINLLDSTSPLMLSMTFFYEYSITFILMIMSMIFYMIMFLTMNKFYSNKIYENQMIEMIWTIAPTIILIFLAIPSLKILYLSEEINSPNLTIKTIGNQWYWSYEYGEFNSINFDSFMKPSINTESFRLLEVDNNIIAPNNSMIRFITTSNDVIHSFALPSMAVKVDAVPGRLNQTSTWLMMTGIFYGQCSEICGMNHSFMPIVLEVSSLNNFLKWTNKF